MMEAMVGAMGPEAKDEGQFLEATVDGNRFSPGDPEGTSSATPDVAGEESPRKIRTGGDPHLNISPRVAQHPSPHSYDSFWIFDFQNCKITCLCCFKRNTSIKVKFKKNKTKTAPSVPIS